MQYINGHAGQHDQSHAFTAIDEINAENEQAANNPAMVFLNAQVLTRIWANPNHWGGITWKVDQLRMKAPTAKSRFAKNFFPGDLWDAMRGLYQASRWIKKAERRKRRSDLWK